MNLPTSQVEMEKCLNYIVENLDFPETSQDDIPERKKSLQFVVEKDGNITNIQVIHPRNVPEYNQEIMRMIQSMPKWIPGKINEEAVRSSVYFPIQICLE